MNDQPIRPRTKEERLAYMAGYAAAINDVAAHDLAFGSEHVRLMAELEGITFAGPFRFERTSVTVGKQGPPDAD